MDGDEAARMGRRDAAPLDARPGRRLTLEDLRAAVWGPPVGRERSDWDLTPELRRKLGDKRRLRPAAVLCAITPREDGLHVILTRRADHLKAHAGQIAFPGGKIDPQDRSPLAAALREAEEEIGLRREELDVLGAIERYETGTGFRVTPFVAATRRNYQPIIDVGEVAELFEAPLDHVLDLRNYQRCVRETPSGARRFYAVQWRDRFIWGATAAMLKTLADRVAVIRSAAEVDA